MISAPGLIKCPNYIAVCSKISKVYYLYAFRSTLLTKVDTVSYGETERGAIEALEQIVDSKRSSKLLPGGKTYAHVYKKVDEDTGRYKYRNSFVTDPKKDKCLFVKCYI